MAAAARVVLISSIVISFSKQGLAVIGMTAILQSAASVVPALQLLDHIPVSPRARPH
jgi:hypothetical protein